MPHLQTSTRVENVRGTLRQEVDLLRRVVDDVRTRVSPTQGGEPRYGAARGGLLGQRGSLIKTPIAFLIDTGDNIIGHAHKFAQTNRRLIR